MGAVHQMLKHLHTPSLEFIQLVYAAEASDMYQFIERCKCPLQRIRAESYGTDWEVERAKLKLDELRKICLSLEDVYYEYVEMELAPLE
jgi:hypothetical protein